MKQTNKQNSQKLRIHDPERCSARQRIAIKAKLLFDYLRPPMTPDARFEDWAEARIGKGARLPPNDPTAFRDMDGDIALAQPYAEFFMISSARYFGGAIALILMIETCYEPAIGAPDRFASALLRYQPLVLGGHLPASALLHEFLEVDESPAKWLSGHIRRHRMKIGRDYVHLANSECADLTSREGRGLGSVRLSPLMAAKLAATTPTLRGRKMKACLMEPGLESLDLADNDPALLKLLFMPPARGLASL